MIVRKLKTAARLFRNLALLPEIDRKLGSLNQRPDPQVVPAAKVVRLNGVGQMLPANSGWLAIPDTELQARVVGGAYPDFLASGQESAENLRDVLARNGLSLGQFNATLDFGCGCARTARFMPSYGLGGSLDGVDVDGLQIDFCNNWLGTLGSFTAIPFDPPMPFRDGAFDFVYSLSTFTHFREDYQHIWLRELQRVTAPGGTLILTIAGQRNLMYLDEQQRATLDQEGFVFVEGAARGQHSPDYYHLALHSHDYVRRVWSEYFEIIDIVPEIINQNQHAVLCRRR